MSVIFECDSGFLLDGELLAEETYRGCVAEAGSIESGLIRSREDCTKDQDYQASSSINLRYRKELFDIQVPFMMDSEFLKCKQQYRDRTGDARHEQSMTSDKVPRKRKRQVLESTVNSVKPLMENIIQGCKDHWMELPDTGPVDNNYAARNFAKYIDSLELKLEEQKIFRNDSNGPVVRKLGDALFVIPRTCIYISSSFRKIQCILDIEKRYDFILMDPPWNNKSAKRLQTYEHLDERDLLRLPVTSLTNEGSLVGVWITNNERLQLFVECELFPVWNLTKEAEWTWVKVTKTGAPVQSFLSVHKKPYEKIVFGRVGKCTAVRPIPDGKVVVSVPSALHSHKPRLDDLVKRFLPDHSQCLELFARSLVPGWTSWGLEVLKLQNLAMFEST